MNPTPRFTEDCAAVRRDARGEVEPPGHRCMLQPGHTRLHRCICGLSFEVWE